MDKTKFNQLLNQEIEQMCKIALNEDLAGENNTDITAELINADTQATASLITRDAGVLCGTAWVEKIFEILGGNILGGNIPSGNIKINWYFNDGNALKPNDLICSLSGNARKLLTGERSAMNFLQSLSAVASLTAIYMNKLKGTNCQLLDTRKTIPGMRFGQKYAVSCGGGGNHRLSLNDAYLIKENHILACGGIKQALTQAINNHPDKLLEIEVENLNELQQALDGKAQIIMLDNFSVKQMQQAKKLSDNHPNKAKLEASGNVNLTSIADISLTGVDFISVGALTKDIKAMDLSLRITLTE